MLLFLAFVTAAFSQVTPPIGYGSSAMEGAGYFQFMYIQEYLDGLLGDASCSNSTAGDYVGIWIEMEASLSGFSDVGGDFFLASVADPSSPTDDVQYIFQGTLLDGTSYNVFGYDRCAHTNNDVYVHVEVDEDLSGEYNCKVGFFTGSDDSLRALNSISSWMVDLSTDFGLNRDETQEVDFDDTFYPITHVWPSTGSSIHPEIQTAGARAFWGDAAPEQGSFGITQLVDWSLSGEAGPQLYSAINVDLADLDTELVICYNGAPNVADAMNNDPIMRRGAVVQEDLADMPLNLSSPYMDGAPWCEYCYPADCEPADLGSLEISQNVYGDMQADVDNIADYQGVFVTTYIAGSVGSSGHSVCHNWGSFCSPAASITPTFLGVFMMIGYFLL